ncbi:Bug family tripartite tricarboxylate transporter substrate binding protein [Rhodoplanes sp. Z2-YC6860]|uniref:Bug family tripartite tricarboxylate transporter substrate binding protein n=1 Tax=Rhodoplanes sp. Z2-YC6860 TaxID=674703 RepID=UPI00078D2D0C|nr:tripartite tricarboxylate transporter substrate binding protein [Rhodoplanes sp. Z2-YC6860]AMN38654.1 extra-cytoplasmic solute receptor [Rhodoplanes sp. Z2-YC6860]
MRTLFGFWCFMLAALAPAALAQGQSADTYPNKVITMVVPVPPGGAADFIARLVGQKLSDALGQPVVISNRGGAGGTIASDNVAKSTPDGYTLLLNSITTHGIGPHLYQSLPYDSVKDFTPLIFVANLPLIMTINTGHAMKSVAEVIAYAKANPGKLSFASSGNGGAPHLAGELLQTVAGIKMLHVPYRGSGPAVVDVGAGRVDIMFDAVPSLLPLIQAGKLRPLAAASALRNPVVPDVPTFEELGIKGMEISLWYGLVGPAGLPQPIVQRLNTELAKILKTPEIAENFAKQGALPMGGSPQDYAAFMRSESDRWGAVVRANNIKIE